MTSGVLYIVATPIGNLGDMTPRAIEVLSAVDVIAAEDTRHSAKLLNHFHIRTPLIALHEHNEREQSADFVRQLNDGRRIALISDAGTPLISDPGFRIVRAARAAGIEVIPIPGACAAIAALSAAGLASDRFAFEGFLPAKSPARVAALENLVRETRTLIFYESPHRIVESLQDMTRVFGSEREAAIARELTKKFETVRVGTLAELERWTQARPENALGEFVVLVTGAPVSDEADAESERVLQLLLRELPLKQAAQLAAAITGKKKNALYQRALQLSKESGPKSGV